jgi:hypothetical protein
MTFKSKNKIDVEDHQMSFGGGPQTRAAGIQSPPEHYKERKRSGGKKYGNDRPAATGIAFARTGGFSTAG